ncbi:MAG: hypothetical protein FDZ70_11100, partial [Actinobacteria bacterium]
MLSHMPRRILTAALTCLLTATAAAPASAAVVGFFDGHAAQEAILSEMALHPTAIDVDGTTVIAYQGVGFDPYVCSYDAANDAWDGPYRVGTNLLSLDAHGAPALFRDSLGRLHALHGAHNGPLGHSVAPGTARLDSWSSLSVVDTAATYPQPLEMGGGEVLLYHRGRGYDWFERNASGECTTFSAPRAVLKADQENRWYADFRNAPDGTVHAAFVRVSVAEYEQWGFARHDVYHMRRAPDGSWAAADGTPLTLPVDRAEADAHCRILDTGSDWANEVSVKTDAAGRPLVLALTGFGAGPRAFSWRLLRWDGAAWRSSEITSADHFFDSGALRVCEDGSLEAFLVYGESDAAGGAPGDCRGRGGTIGRFTSDDEGVTW